jgi:hypothetical protein
VQEETEWKAVLEKGSSMLEKGLSVLMTNNTTVLDGGMQPHIGDLESSANSLLPLQSQAHRRLCFQVEPVTTFKCGGFKSVFAAWLTKVLHKLLT